MKLANHTVGILEVKFLNLPYTSNNWICSYVYWLGYIYCQTLQKTNNECMHKRRKCIQIFDAKKLSQQLCTISSWSADSTSILHHPVVSNLSFYIYMHTCQTVAWVSKFWSSTTYTLHEDTSHTKISSQSWRASYKRLVCSTAFAGHWTNKASQDIHTKHAPQPILTSFLA